MLQLIKHATSGTDTVPYNDYVKSLLTEGALRDSATELDGAIWFVSLLSRVDGAVILTPELDVRGFGVEILEKVAPPKVYQATTLSGSSAGLKLIDYHHFGTRHRSMMRHCYGAPGTVGFVVSQDGDVRAMMRVENHLVIWASIRLQSDQFISQRAENDPHSASLQRTRQSGDAVYAA
jgi:hypothetical protein